MGSNIINTEMDALYNSIEKVHALISSLEAQLEPILNDSDVAEDLNVESKILSPTSDSILARNVRSYTLQVQEIGRRVNRLIERCDL